MRLIWNALGLYVSRNLRMGRGVSVPKLGIFTFTPPEINLKVCSSLLRVLPMKIKGIKNRESRSFLSIRSSSKVFRSRLPSSTIRSLVLGLGHTLHSVLRAKFRLRNLIFCKFPHMPICLKNQSN